MRLLNELGRALQEAGSMTWQITWSLILGFTLSAMVQAVVRRDAIARHLGDENVRTLALATGLGAASSSRPSRRPAPRRTRDSPDPWKATPP